MGAGQQRWEIEEFTHTQTEGLDKIKDDIYMIMWGNWVCATTRGDYFTGNDRALEEKLP